VFEIRKVNVIPGNVCGVMLIWKAITDFAEALYRTTLSLNTLYATAKNGLKVH
jgi:hypothetical protein